MSRSLVRSSVWRGGVGGLLQELHSRIRGGGERPGAGGGAGKRAIRAVAQAGGSQAGHGGCPRGAATGSQRPRAPGPSGLLGLRCAGHRPESVGGCLQSSLAGSGAGDHPATRCHHARIRLPLPLPGERVSRVYV